MIINKREYFNITPRVLLVGKETTIKIDAKYNFAIMKDDFYSIMVCPVHQFELERPFFEYNVSAHDGEIEFSFSPTEEQEYIIEVRTDKGLLFKSSIYALEDDLYNFNVYKGDLHMHTPYSDGIESPEHRLAMCRKKGLDFIAITDHNNFQGSNVLKSKVEKMNLGISVLHGEEVHAKNCKAHILSLGASESVVPFVCKESEERNQRISLIEEEYKGKVAEADMKSFAAAIDVFRKIKEKGGVSFFAHPYWRVQKAEERKREDIPLSLSKSLFESKEFDGFELVSGAPRYEAYNNSYQEKLYLKYYPNYEMPIIGITDSHTSSDELSTILGVNYTIVFSKTNSQEDILHGIMNGYSVGVENFMLESPRLHGKERLCKYGLFLIKEFFKLHDENAFAEGQMLLRCVEEKNFETEMIDSWVRYEQDYCDRWFGKINE